MVTSFLIAVFFKFVYPHLGMAPLSDSLQLVLGVAVTTTAWVTVTLLTRPTDERTLDNFFTKIRPGGPGWRQVASRLGAKDKVVASDDALVAGFSAMFAAIVLVYAILFTIGNAVYGHTVYAGVSLVIAVSAYAVISKLWRML